jgi:hypothetical protein
MHHFFIDAWRDGFEEPDRLRDILESALADIFQNKVSLDAFRCCYAHEDFALRCLSGDPIGENFNTVAPVNFGTAHFLRLGFHLMHEPSNKIGTSIINNATLKADLAEPFDHAERPKN